MAATEDAHAATWAEKLKAANVAVPPLKLGWRTRTLIWAAHRFGPSAVLPSMAAMEKRGDQSYHKQGAPDGMAQQERSHGMLLNTISQTAHGGMEGPALAKLEGRHRSAGGNALRAAVLGANDGLVSNFSLVMGVAGAEVTNGTIVLTGIAGLLAGAISMALGEWVSVQSSRELYQKQIRTEKEEIAANPAEEAEELSLIYQARGLEESAARQLAQQMMSSEESAMEALSRDEFGIDPEELGGSAWEAAITSFLLFAMGAIIPLVPVLLYQRRHRHRHQRHPQRHRLVRHRRGHYALHRPLGALLRHAADVVRSGRCRNYLLDRTTNRREYRRVPIIEGNEVN